MKDGVTLVNSYGPELDTLREGDCIGVMKTSKVAIKRENRTFSHELVILNMIFLIGISCCY